MRRQIDLSLYLITDQRLSKGRDQLELIAAAIRGGVTAVQLRDKELSTQDQYEFGLRLRALTRRSGIALICNDRVDLAIAIDADGVHLGQDDLPPRVARDLLGPERLIGVSTGNPTEFELFRRVSADYLGVGPFALTGSKSDAGAAIGATGIAAVRALTDLPMVAIGGIGVSNAASAIAAGATGISVISAIVGADDPESAARALRKAIDTVRNSRL